MSENRMAYVGRCSCGGWVMVTMDEPDRRKDTSKFVAEIIRNGYTAEHMTVDAIKEIGACPNQGQCDTIAKHGKQEEMFR